MKQQMYLDGWNCLLATSEVKSGIIFETFILTSYSAPILFQYIASIAACPDDTLQHAYVNGNGSSFFTATFEMCGNPSFGPTQKLITVTFVYLSFNSVFLNVN
jgi:hypothetical protein